MDSPLSRNKIIIDLNWNRMEVQKQWQNRNKEFGFRIFLQLNSLFGIKEDM